VSPCHANGPGKPVADKPFLASPYHGPTTLVSYFDHDSPNYLRDGLVITTTGLHAAVDAQHQASNFPAYWSSGLRQYVYYDGHNGYDYDISYQPVYAAAAGKVIFADFEYSYAQDHGYGQMVMISHSHGYVTLYGHLSKLLVHAGRRVHRGQLLGISGNTGHSSGPHLHFTVFHNCSPTDPYGWSGGGPDPLAGYQSESSHYLWLRQPEIINPPPAWPHVADLSAIISPRLLLVKLPNPRSGTRTFTWALKRRLIQAEHSLLVYDPGAHTDMLRGAVDFTGGIPPARLYALPWIASIGDVGSGADAKLDVLSALSEAADHSRHHAIRLGHAKHWNGYVVQWQGRSVLVGHGQRGKMLQLRLPLLGKRILVPTIRASVTDGSYAVDLGKLSKLQVHALTSALHAHKAQTRVITRRSSRGSTLIERSNGSNSSQPLIAVILLVLLGVIGAAVYKRPALVRLADRLHVSSGKPGQ